MQKPLETYTLSRNANLLSHCVTGFSIMALMVGLLSTCYAGPEIREATNLESEFQNPPRSARVGAFWPWLNGQTDKDRLVYDLQQMKEKGMSGAEIWDVQAMRNGDMIPAGPEFLSPESAERIRFALGEARKLDLRMGMITSSGWNAGGTWVSPDWASKLLVSSSFDTTGPLRLSEKLPFPDVPEHCPKGADGLPVWYKDVAVLAVPFTTDRTILGPEQIIDLTSQVKADGTLDWEVPEGPWQILRFVCTNTGQELIVPSPKSKGLFIDFLDPDATRRHLQTIMDKLGITPKNAAESGLHYLEVDSMELHPGNPWTDKFGDWFARHHGYDLLKWMPVLAGWTIKDEASSEAFSYDYRKTVSDLLIHSHYETGSEFLGKYGIEFVGEAGGPGPPIWDTCPVDALKALGNVTVPRGEFWIQHRNMFLIKEVASAAHIYGKPVVDAESFTTWRRWEDSPFVLKMAADRAFAEGLNHLTIHTFAHSPDAAGLPGWTYHAGIDINPNTTWWPYARHFMDYLARCSHMLQQGLPVADVLWYYGDQAPNFFPKFHNVPEKPRLPVLGRGYDYDVVNSDVILNRLKVENGRFVLPEGTSYKVLAFPDDASMTLEVLQKLEEFVKQGGIVVGNPPKQEPGLHEREQRTQRLKELTSELWGDAATSEPLAHGAGKTYWLQPLDVILAAEGVEEDFAPEDAPAKTPNLDYIHRRTTDRDIYFVRNDQNEPRDAQVRFRTSYKNAELWDAATGHQYKGETVAVKDGSHTLNLNLAQGGSVFVVISDKPSTAPAPLVDTQSVPVTPNEWTLQFTEGRGAPTSVTLEKLKSWTDFDDDGIKYFSGTAEYHTTFQQDTLSTAGTERLLLDVGRVKDVAEVLINGKPVGFAWKPPYRFDVTDHLKPGKNTLTVRVTNQWHNRRVGDAKVPPEQRITKSNQPLPGKDAQLMESGLMGPLTLITAKPGSGED